MKEYIKTLKFDIKIDNSKMTDIERRIERLKINDLFSDKEQDNLKKIQDAYRQMQINLEKIETIKESIAELSELDTNEAKELTKQLQAQLKTLQSTTSTKPDKAGFSSIGQDFKSEISKMFGRQGTVGESLADGVKKITDTFVKGFKDMMSEAKAMFEEMASYDLGNSLFSNSSAREQALQYGLSNDQNYALTQTMNALSMKSEEDLMYMNPTQHEKFAELMGVYSARYNKLENEGFFQEYQEFQLEFKQFKEEMQMDLISFFMENKEMIKSVMKMSISFMKGALEFFDFMLKLFDGQRTENERAATTSDIISNYTSANTANQTTSVKVDNTFNGVGNNDRQSLVNAGELTYQQIIKALGGK